MTATTIFAIYISTIFMVVQFRGDYGVMSDCQIQIVTKERLMNSSRSDSGGLGSVSSTGYRSRSGRLSRHHSSSQLNNNEISSNSNSTNMSNGIVSSSTILFGCCNSGCSDCCKSLMSAIVEIPGGDIELLGSQVTAGYGSKLYNMKDNFKDI